MLRGSALGKESTLTLRLQEGANGQREAAFYTTWEVRDEAVFVAVEVKNSSVCNY